MYSIKCDEELRYAITCLINKGCVRKVLTLIDTGAIYTCYRANKAVPYLCEKDLANNKTITLGGFVDSSVNSMKFYAINIPQFTIWNIDLGPRTIYVSFDSRMHDDVIGMDILKDINFLQLAKTSQLLITQDSCELQEYLNDITDIHRKVYYDKNKHPYIELYGMHCYINTREKRILKDSKGNYIKIGMRKCYLI